MRTSRRLAYMLAGCLTTLALVAGVQAQDFAYSTYNGTITITGIGWDGLFEERQGSPAEPPSSQRRLFCNSVMADTSLADHVPAVYRLCGCVSLREVLGQRRPLCLPPSRKDAETECHAGYELIIRVAGTRLLRDGLCHTVRP